VSTPLLALDLETTGLGYDDADPAKVKDDAILEVAAILVDSVTLEEIDEFGPFPISTSTPVLALMNDFVRNMHTTTGLIDRVQHPSARPLGTVDAELSKWMASHGATERVHLLGSSVSLDALFIRRHMPKTFARLHYRILDVSSFAVAMDGWDPKVAAHIQEIVGDSTHEAMADIRRSLAILRLYRQMFLSGARSGSLSLQSLAGKGL